MKQKFLSAGIWTILCLLPAWMTSADTQAADRPFNQVTREIWFCGSGSNRKAVNIDVTVQATGLWGPLPAKDPSRAKFDKQKALSEASGHLEDGGPFIDISAYQVPGEPVNIQVVCPTAEEIGFQRSSHKDTYRWFETERRHVFFHLNSKSGPSDEKAFNQAIGLKVDEEAGTISWTPAVVTDKRGRSYHVGPELIEVLVSYRAKSGYSDEGKLITEDKGSVTRRVGWLVLPICGLSRSGDYIPCPQGAGTDPKWRSCTVGNVSIAVPDHWQENLSPGKDEGEWRLGGDTVPPAGVMVLRQKDPESFIKLTQVEKEGAITLGGKPGRFYFGLIQDGKATGKLVVTDETDDKGRTMIVGASSSDWKRYETILEASLASLTFGPRAELPDLPAALPGPQIGRLVTPAAPGTTVPGPAAPSQTEAPAGKLSLEEQQALAKKLFQQMIDTPENEYDVFEKLYKEVMERCPDTPQAETSYWRLSNLYLMAYEPPKLEEMIPLLEAFFVRYPESDGVPHVKQRLIVAYEETGRWCKAADLYAETLPEPPTDPATDGQIKATHLLYAEALAKCGRMDQARIWYQVVVKADRGEDSLEGQVAREALGRLDKTSGTPSKAAESADAATQEGTVGQAPHVTPSDTAPVGKAVVRAVLVRKPGFADFVGRHGQLKGDGSPDSRFALEITAPTRAITALAITSTSGQSSAWDTIPGNDAWLLGVARKGKVLNQPDGNVELPLAEGTQKYDLFVQDNNSIAGRKTVYQITVGFADGGEEVFSVEDVP